MHEFKDRDIMGPPSLDEELDRAQRWAVDHALPLWASSGFDHSSGQFEEQLSLDGMPIGGLPRRVMVQARQISVYLLATELGWYEGRELALEAGRALVHRYWAADGRPGWAFSLRPDGAVADSRRDLYAHAFVLFALAWLVRASKEDAFLSAIELSIDYLDSEFRDTTAGGFWDCLPAGDGLRRQNPHMHLLEAELELARSLSAPRHLGRARHLVDLCLDHFLDRATGALREVFDSNWNVSPGPGLGLVEPGHQCEWAWLLRRYDALSGSDHEVAIQAMLRAALDHGLHRSSGRIIDELGEKGEIRSRNSRLWPHTEALKVLAVETVRGTADYRTDIALILRRLNGVFCPASLMGGWIDRVSDTDAPLSGTMPASSLYHLMLAFDQLWHCFRRPATAPDLNGAEAIPRDRGRRTTPDA